MTITLLTITQVGMEHLLSQSLESPSNVIYNIIIFVNSESGGKHGQPITDSKIKGIEMGDMYLSSLYFFNINQISSRNKGMAFIDGLIAKADQKYNRIVVLAGGGDGTVNWLLSELIESRIDMQKIVFGAFPLGTGNDFAKNLGWKEYKLFDNGFQQLQQFVQNVKHSRIQDFDVWEVQADYGEGGSISQQRDGQQRKILSRPFLRQVTNYFSFGMDARVGYHFDTHRSNFQFINYALYCLIGCCNKFRSLPSVQKVVTNMQESDSEVEQEDPNRMSVIFKSQEQKLSLKKYRNIVALNINSYMGGVSNVWQYSKPLNLSSHSRVSFQGNDHSDGLLQFVAFKDEWSLGFERYFRGRARKVAQGKGPFRFEFNPDCRFTYLNFDGEYYKIYQPKCVIVRRSPHFSEFKLKVLRFPSAQ